jgi:hypothetical protein
MKEYKSIRIKKVTAYPLNKKGECFSEGYFISITNGFKLPPIGEDFIIPNIRNAAKGIMSDTRLSYNYKSGDITCFNVKYQLDSKSGTRTLTFVTKKSES